MKLLSKKLKWFMGVLALIITFYVFFLNYIDYTEIGIEKNMLTGYVSVQNEAGWHLTAPWIFVVSVDKRPMRVSVQSSGHAISSRLVQFEPKYWNEFVQTEGWGYYWLSNRLSFNIGHKEEHRGMRDILRGYAYSSTKYPFITILETL